MRVKPDITPAHHPLDDTIVTHLRETVPGLHAIYRYGTAGGVYERTESDIDLAILADKPLDMTEQIQLGTQLMRRCGRDIDLNDMRALPLGLKLQIILDGARLYATDIAAAEEYDSRVLSDYVRLNEERREILNDIAQRGRIYG